MRFNLKRSGSLFVYRIICAFLLVSFSVTAICPPSLAQVLPQPILNLPIPGTIVKTSPVFNPVLIKGLTIHPEHPLQFDFIINEGDTRFDSAQLKEESTKLIKYFLAALTVPEKNLWVNLSPYEADRIVAEGLASTEMGRDLLAQDYLLKQLSASLVYPEDELGKKFWDRVYQKALAKFGTTEIPLNTFNKIWVVPQKAVIYEQGPSAFVVEARLKVLLEEDLKARASGTAELGLKNAESDIRTDDASKLSSDIIREILIPEIEKEVNEGQTFANLRQIYNSLVLAVWYKGALRESLLGKVYFDQQKTKGITPEDRDVNQKIYEQYLVAFKTGVYNYIKEEYDLAQKQLVPRKYFSGGAGFENVAGHIQVIGQRLALTAGQIGVITSRGDFGVRGIFLENTDSAMLAQAAGEGPAMRWSGLPLTPEQHQIVNQAIAEYFTDAQRIAKRRQVRREELKKVDKANHLQGIAIYILPGLKARVSELISLTNASRPDGQKILDPADLITHVGREKYQSLYLDEGEFQMLLAQSDAWLEAWAAHEAAHIEHPKASEEWIQEHYPLPWKIKPSAPPTSSMPAVIPPAETPSALPPPATISSGNLLPAMREERALALPPAVGAALTTTVIRGTDLIVPTIMGNPATVAGLLSTQAWNNPDDLRGSLRNIAFGAPTPETIRDARQFAALVSASGNRLAPLVVADALADRRIDSEAFMSISDEILRKHDPALAENLEGLLKENPEAQRLAFQWLFGRMVQEAQELSVIMQDIAQSTDDSDNILRRLYEHPQAQQHILTGRIILKQINKLLSNSDKSKWEALRIHVLMEFAKRMSAESNIAEKPLMAMLMALYPDVARDFFLAVDSNFVYISGAYKNEFVDARLKSYGGYEGYAQAVETLLAFANLAWPDWFFGYLQSKYAHANNVARAHYLSAMRFGMTRKNKTTGESEIIPGRLRFVLSSSIDLAEDRAELVKKKIREILFNLPEEFIRYMEEDERYLNLPAVKRGFLIEVLLAVAAAGKIENARRRILPFVMHEMTEKDNIEIQQKIFISTYFNDEILTELSEEQGKQLRAAIIEGHFEFKKNDIMARNLERIMTTFGMKAIDEGYDYFHKRYRVDYDKAYGVLLLTAKVASVYKTEDPEEKKRITKIIKAVSYFASETLRTKVSAMKDYYSLRDQASEILKELISLEKQVETAQMTVAAVSKEMEEIQGRKKALENEQRSLRTEYKDNERRHGAASMDKENKAQEEGLDHEAKMARRKALAAEIKSAELRMGQIKIRQSQIKKELEEMTPALAEAEKKQVAISEEVNEFIKQFAAKKEWVEKTAGKLEGMQTRQEQEQEDKERAKKEHEDQMEMVFGKERVKKDAPAEVTHEETDLNKAIDRGRKAGKYFRDMQIALRLLIMNPSLEDGLGVVLASGLQKSDAELIRALEPDPKVADRYARLMSSTDGEAVLTMFTMLNNPLLASSVDLEELQRLLSERLYFVAARGLYKDELMALLDFLNEKARQGVLIAQSKEDKLMQTVIDLLRDKRYQLDEPAEMARLAAKQQKVNAEVHKTIKEKVLGEIIQIGSNSDLLAQMMEDFLKLKFGYDTEAGAKRVSQMMDAFGKITQFFGAEVAVEYILAITYARYFVKPQEKVIEKPTTRAEQMEKRYRIYYDIQQKYRDSIFETNQSMMKIEEGLGWAAAANDTAVYYLMSIFTHEAASAEVKAEAERALQLLVFLPWVAERERDLTRKKEKEEKRLSVSPNTLLDNMNRYVAKAPPINTQNQEGVTEGYSGKLLVSMSYGLARRAIDDFDKLVTADVPKYLQILQCLAQVIAADVMTEVGASGNIPVLIAIQEAIARLKKEEVKKDPSSARLLANPDDIKMRFRLTSGQDRPQLPGPPESDTDGKTDKKDKPDQAMLARESPLAKLIAGFVRRSAEQPLVFVARDKEKVRTSLLRMGENFGNLSSTFNLRQWTTEMLADDNIRQALVVSAVAVGLSGAARQFLADADAKISAFKSKQEERIPQLQYLSEEYRKYHEGKQDYNPNHNGYLDEILHLQAFKIPAEKQQFKLSLFETEYNQPGSVVRELELALLAAQQEAFDSKVRKKSLLAGKLPGNKDNKFVSFIRYPPARLILEDTAVNFQPGLPGQPTAQAMPAVALERLLRIIQQIPLVAQKKPVVRPADAVPQLLFLESADRGEAAQGLADFAATVLTGKTPVKAQVVNIGDHYYHQSFPGDWVQEVVFDPADGLSTITLSNHKQRIQPRVQVLFKNVIPGLLQRLSNGAAVPENPQEAFVQDFTSIHDLWAKVLDMYGDPAKRGVTDLVVLSPEEIKGRPLGQQYFILDEAVKGQASPVDRKSGQALSLTADQPPAQLMILKSQAGATFRLYLDTLNPQTRVAKVMVVIPNTREIGSFDDIPRLWQAVVDIYGKHEDRGVTHIMVIDEAEAKKPLGQQFFPTQAEFIDTSGDGNYMPVEREAVHPALLQNFPAGSRFRLSVDTLNPQMLVAKVVVLNPSSKVSTVKPKAESLDLSNFAVSWEWGPAQGAQKAQVLSISYKDGATTVRYEDARKEPAEVKEVSLSGAHVLNYEKVRQGEDLTKTFWISSEFRSAMNAAGIPDEFSADQPRFVEETVKGKGTMPRAPNTKIIFKPQTNTGGADPAMLARPKKEELQYTAKNGEGIELEYDPKATLWPGAEVKEVFDYAGTPLEDMTELTQERQPENIVGVTTRRVFDGPILREITRVPGNRIPQARKSLKSVAAKADPAMLSAAGLAQGKSKVEPPGGIDLNPAFLDLQIKRDKDGIPLPLGQQPLQTIRIDGLYPVIIQIAPVNLPLLLGWADELNPEEGSPAKAISRQPSSAPDENRREETRQHPGREPEKVSLLN